MMPYIKETRQKSFPGTDGININLDKDSGL